MATWLRSWCRSPLLTGQFSVTIAIGMGALTALVSLMLALGYQPLPFREPGELVAIWERVESGRSVMAISGPDMADFADATHNIFNSLGVFAVPQLWLFDRRGATEVRTNYIQANVFSVLGIHPVLGRGVLPDDEPSGPMDSGIPGTAWISYRLWQSRYGGSPSVIGATIGITISATGADQQPMRIAGVLPPGVNIPLPFTENTADVWYLLERNVASRPRKAPIFFGVGRLRPGASAAQAQAALTVVEDRLGQQYSFERGKRPVVQGLEEIAHGPARQTMGLLSLGIGLVFLAGCANLAILMGAEGRQRRREIAVRVALGADRWRLWREVAAEKCVLTLFSLALGWVFAFALLRVLTQLLPAAGLGPPLPHSPPLNLAVLFGFAAIVFILAFIWSALLVAAAEGQGSSRVLAASGSGLGYAGLSDSSPGANRWRLVFLVVQSAVGVCVLAVASLAARTYSTLSVANLGPDPRHTMLFSVSTRDNVILNDAQVADVNQQLLTRLDRLPGTKAIALADWFPPLGFPTTFVKQDGAIDTPRETSSPISVTSGYFKALGIPLVFGRGFDDSDNRRSEPVAIVSLEMAKQNWISPEQAVNSQIAFGTKFQDRYKIVGVAADFTGYWSQKPVPTVYLPEAQSPNWSGQVILRTTTSPRAVAALIPQVVAGISVPTTISDVSTMHARWQATLTRPLARMTGMLLFALLSLALSIQGVFAVAAGTVAALRHELAVRSALGARPRRLIWHLIHKPILAVTVGAAFGVGAALELRPLLQQWLGHMAGWEPLPIVVAIVLIALASAAGCYFPARAAVQTNPVDVLREG
jgi:putative ABC transport system permease protein